MENTAFCKDLKKQLKDIIESKDLTIPIQNELINKFVDKLENELRAKQVTGNDIRIVTILINRIRESFDKLKYFSFDNKLVKILKFISMLYTACLCVNIFKDSSFRRKLVFLALLDYSHFERNIPLRKFQTCFTDEEIHEYNDLVLALQEIHLVEYSGKKHKNGGISEKHERIRSLLTRILIKNSKHRDKLNEKFCETFVTLCRKKDVLALVLVERFVLLKFLEFYPTTYFSNRDKYRLCEETKIVHARISDRLGFYWAKWRLVDTAFKYSDPDNFRRIVDHLKKTRKEREKFIEKKITKLYLLIKKSNLNEGKKGWKILTGIKEQLALLNMNQHNEEIVKSIFKFIDFLIEDLKGFCYNWKNDVPPKNKKPIWRKRTFAVASNLIKYIEQHELPESIEQILNSIENSLGNIKLVEIQAIDGRPKNIYSIYKKELERKISVDNHPDLIGIRLTVKPSKVDKIRILENMNKKNNNTNGTFNVVKFLYCYHVRDLLLTKFGNTFKDRLFFKFDQEVKGINKNKYPALLKYKDFISCPKSNGYQAIHLVFETGNKSFPSIEFQIMDLKMEQTAEFGIAAHWLYDKHKKSKKNGNSIWKYFQKKMLNNSSNKICVLTPDLDLMHLPKESTALDFAYNIHSEVGHQCASAIVNDKEVEIGTKLNDGDMVEIDKSMTVTPKDYWLNMVKSGRARYNIKKYFEQNGYGNS